jgi:predicted RNA-binding protein YlqC (UPF0109 family)
MKELLLLIAKSLVDKPEAVSVAEAAKDRGTTLTLHVDQSDMGKVIGKQGKIARAIRNIVKAAAIHQSVHVTVEIGQ